MKFKIVIIIMLLLGAISSKANLIEKINSVGQTLACNMQLDIIKMIRTQDLAATRSYQYNNPESIGNETLDSIDGIYIPKDICEALQIIDNNISKDLRKEYLDIKDLSNNRPILPIPSEWGPYYNSRLCHNIKNKGIINWYHLSFLLGEAYWCYLHNKPFLTTKYLDVNFKLDSNLFVFQSPNCIFDTSDANMYSCYTLKGRRKDLYLAPAFPKSYKYNEGFFDNMSLSKYENDTTIREYEEIFAISSDINTSRVDTNFIAESITDSEGQLIFNSITLNSIRLKNLDSILVLETIDGNSFTWNCFANNIQSDVQRFYVHTQKLVFISSISPSTLDSLDNVFSVINQRLRLEEPNGISSMEWQEHNTILSSTLINKKAVEITVVRLFPYHIIDCWVKKEN